MKMIPAGTAAANLYKGFAHNCLRNWACEGPYTAPLPTVSDMQLYADFGAVQPTTMEFTFIDHCNNTTEQIFPAQYTVGQTPEGGWYGVFRDFNNPAVPFTAFVVHLSINGGSNTYFSEMLSTEPCGPLMKIKSCHPEGATTTGFDVNGVYYGLPQGAYLGTGIRYWHIAWVRNGKVRELNDKATFKSNLYSNFRTTIEKTHLIQTEIVPKWYKNVLLAIYSRGALSVDEGQIYLVNDLAFEAINDDDLQWKPYAQLKETFRLFYGCDDARCETCCNPQLISVQINDGPPVSSSSQGPSEPAPTGCLRVIFAISGSGPWAIGGLMCDGHALSMEAVAGDGIVPLPLCVQYDSLTGIAPPVSIIFTEPCPNDCVIYRNPSLTEFTTGITYKDCAGVWHEDITLLPGQEICARRSYVIGPTTGVNGPGSGTLEEVGPCGSFPDDSESAGGSGSGPGPSEPPAEVCCDPTIIDADTETIIPDGSLPGGDSESESDVCCTPVVLSAEIETLPDDSGSASDSGSEPPPPNSLRLIFSTDQSALTVSDWNTNFDTGSQAITPFTSVVYSAGGTIVDLFGHTVLQVVGVFISNLQILEMYDYANEVFSIDVAFNGASNFTTIDVPVCLNFNANSFFDCISLVSVNAPSVTNANAGCFQNCSSLVSISLPACTSIDNSCFAFCSSIQNINLPVCTSIISGFNFRAIGDGVNPITINTPVATPYGGTSGDDLVFFGVTGQTITITLPASETGDGDITTVSGANSVTLIPV